MSSNCPTYKKLLQDLEQELQTLEELYRQFLTTGDLGLEEKLKTLKKNTTEARQAYLDFAYEKIEVEKNRTTKETERIQNDLEKKFKTLTLDENTPWKTIEILSKIPNITSNLTKIKQEFKDRLVAWQGSIQDDSYGDLSYSNLQTVGGNLYARGAKTFSADSLRTVRGYLNIWNATVFSADSLRTVEGSLFANSAKTFSAKELEEVRNIKLTKANFQEFFTENSFNWEKAFQTGKLMIQKQVREKVIYN